MMNLALGLLLSLSLAAPATVAPPDAADKGETYTAECTLSNAAYSGTCVVTESAPKTDTPETVCGRVLDCLNDSRCIKTYCNATTVRSGWSLDSSKEKGK